MEDTVIRPHPRESESDEVALCCMAIQAGDVVVEGGAGTGVTTMAMAERGARVFAFEPNPDLARDLTAAGARVVFQAGLARVAGTREWYRRAWSMNSSFSLDDPEAPGRAVVDSRVVDCYAIADVLRELRPTVLVLDVEGEEVELLAAAAHADDALTSVRDVIFESHGSIQTAACWKILDDAGFVLEFAHPLRFGRVQSFWFRRHA